MTELDSLEAHPGVSAEELDLTAVVPAEDRHLTIGVLWREVRAAGEPEGAVVNVTTERYPVRGTLAIPTMTSFLRLETRINDALAMEAEDGDQELEKVLDESHDRIVSLITERTPHAFAEREHEGKRVVGAIELDVSQILVTLSWIAGDVTVADAVARALTAGKSGAKTEEELAAEGAGEDGTGGGGAPLA